MRLSIIIPVYNERDTIGKIVEKVQEVKLDKQIIIVDDGSTDGTGELLKGIKEENVKIFYHERNLGKGAAVRTGLQHVNGDIVIIQDADLEYTPQDYPQLIKPILDGNADVVYGSRFYGPHRVFMFWHFMGNKFLNLLTNLMYNANLSDMEVGYKAFRTEAIRSFSINSNRFNIEPEITAKVLKRKYRVFEVPIYYSGRTYEEGKKITWKDGLIALFTLIKYRFVD